MTARDHMKDMKDIRPRQAFRERTSQEIMFKLRLDTKSANWCVCVCVCVCVWCVWCVCGVCGVCVCVCGVVCVCVCVCVCV